MIEEKFKTRFPKDQYAEFYIGKNFEYLIDFFNQAIKAERKRISKIVEDSSLAIYEDDLYRVLKLINKK